MGGRAAAGTLKLDGGPPMISDPTTMSKTKRVLIIDDSDSIRRQVSQTLRPAGYDVVEAVDGVDGLNMIRTTALSLVLCDVNMPRMGGMEMLTELSQEKPTPIIVMLTTEAQPSLIRRAREMGAIGWIVKPFKADLLIAAVNKLTLDSARLS